MPWSIVERDGKYCVVKDSDGSTVKCHTARSDALKHQRALYANEPSASTAGIEVEWDEEIEEEPSRNGPIRIEVGAASNEVAEALVASMNKLAERLENAESLVEKLAHLVESDRETLVAAIGHLSASVQEAISAQPEINVQVPEIVMPEIPAPIVTVQPPEVNVTVESPVSQKKIVVERDPLTGLIASADVTES